MSKNLKILSVFCAYLLCEPVCFPVLATIFPTDTIIVSDSIRPVRVRNAVGTPFNLLVKFNTHINGGLLYCVSDQALIGEHDSGSQRSILIDPQMSSPIWLFPNNGTIPTAVLNIKSAPDTVFRLSPFSNSKIVLDGQTPSLFIPAATDSESMVGWSAYIKSSRDGKPIRQLFRWRPDTIFAGDTVIINTIAAKFPAIFYFSPIISNKVINSYRAVKKNKSANFTGYVTCKNFNLLGRMIDSKTVNTRSIDRHIGTLILRR